MVSTQLFLLPSRATCLGLGTAGGASSSLRCTRIFSLMFCLRKLSAVVLVMGSKVRNDLCHSLDDITLWKHFFTHSSGNPG